MAGRRSRTKVGLAKLRSCDCVDGAVPAPIVALLPAQGDGATSFHPKEGLG